MISSVRLLRRSSRDALASIDILEITEERMEKVRTHTPFIETLADIERQFPPAVAALLRNESIVSIATLPLLGRQGPIAQNVAWKPSR